MSGLFDQRSPDVLRSQTENALLTLGGASSYMMIMAIDPLFTEFLENECGLDVDRLTNALTELSAVLSQIKDQHGIVTNENCERFLKEKARA